MGIFNKFFNKDMEKEAEKLMPGVETETQAEMDSKPLDFSGVTKQIRNLRTNRKADDAKTPYQNPILDKYYKNLGKQETRLDKGKSIDVSSPMSERYVIGGDIGQKDTTGSHAKTSGWSGLFTLKQMQDAGVDLSDKDVSTADIRSTAIERVRYNPKTQNLYITFVGGDKEYLYPNVPEDTVRKMLNASSKGRYFGERVKRYAVSKDEAMKIKARDKDN